MLKISYSSYFDRKMKKLDSSLRPIVEERESMFRQDCFHPQLETHKLNGKWKDHWAFSITKKYRIMFQFLGNNEVMFEDVDDHDVYRSR